MWFKNLTLFRFTEPFTLSPVQLAEQLHSMAFRPCSAHEAFSLGWIAPLGKYSEQLVHTANGYIMLCVKQEEKVLPSAVVNEILQEKIEALEAKDNRKLSKKARSALKDELIFDLLPKAFAFSRKTYAYLDPKGGWLVVDTASTKKAEELLTLLRKCIGSLPAVPPATVVKPTTRLTQWLLADELPPTDIKLEDECELRAPEETGAIIRCKRHDLTVPEITNHLNTGKQVIKVAVTWEDRLNFVLDEQLSIKRLKFLDLVQEQADITEAQDAAEQFDIEFTIMTAELANFLPRLLALFDGELQT